jgi:hypothetical protein
MGRGRAKAKQTKVARDLKYRSYSTDFGSLERELRSEPGDVGYVAEPVPVPVEEPEDDQYSGLADRYSVDDEPGETEYRRIS